MNVKKSLKDSDPKVTCPGEGLIIIIYKENARARGYDLLGPAYLGGQGFGYGGRCEEEVV